VIINVKTVLVNLNIVLSVLTKIDQIPQIVCVIMGGLMLELILFVNNANILVLIAPEQESENV
jgi:hypothetical protein